MGVIELESKSDDKISTWSAQEQKKNYIRHIECEVFYYTKQPGSEYCSPSFFLLNRKQQNNLINTSHGRETKKG